MRDIYPDGYGGVTRGDVAHGKRVAVAFLFTLGACGWWAVALHLYRYLEG